MVCNCLIFIMIILTPRNMVFMLKQRLSLFKILIPTKRNTFLLLKQIMNSDFIRSSFPSLFLQEFYCGGFGWWSWNMQYWDQELNFYWTGIVPYLKSTGVQLTQCWALPAIQMGECQYASSLIPGKCNPNFSNTIFIYNFWYVMINNYPKEAMKYFPSFFIKGNISSCNDLVSSGTKPSSELMLYKLYDSIWHMNV